MEADFVKIDNVIVNKDILDCSFTCDLGKCKGACCTMESLYGAPITQDEIEIITKHLNEIIAYLPPEHVKEIDKKGFWVKQHDELMTRSMNNRECVFVFYDGDVAKCGIEKAYYDKKIDFIKPVSCHLFPIRISNFGGPILRYERYKECEPAVEKGKQTQIKILDFCKDAVIREFGNDFYKATKEEIGK